jgi:DNA-binding transcriptional LysR family regulator
MELDDIRAFVAVADAGSVSGAARELFLTQPAVTRRLQRLESAMGAPLLDRHRRPFTLTRAGQAALDRCRGVLVSLQELRTAAGADQEPAGELRIGVAHALTELTLARPVDQVQRSFPRVGLRLSTGWSRDLLERVRTQVVDAAFLLLPEGEALPASVAGVRVADEQLVVVAPRSLRLGAVRAPPTWPA